VCAVLAAGVVAGCGKDNGGGGSSGGGGGSVKTGIGVTDKTISLGLITDLSGIFAPLAIPLVDGTKLYWAKANAAGGVCGRQVKLIIKDNGYDVQKAVVQYRAIQPDVAAFQELLGSPMTAALAPKLKSDGTFAMLVSWASSLLGQDNLVITGATYDLEQINALSYLMDKGLLKKGDKIGDVYFEGEYGENGLKGTQAFADANGMSVVEQKIQPTDEDMTGQVAALKRAGVKAISVTTGPTQLASVAGVAAGSGFNVPVTANNPAYDPALLASPAGPAVKANVYVGQSVVAYNSKAPGAVAARKAFEKKYGTKNAKAAVGFGWAQAAQMKEILSQACDDGDLTRDGLVKAVSQVKGSDFDGIMSGKLDYSDRSAPSTRASFVLRPADVPGGLKQLGGAIESKTAKGYDPAA
jgi:ABC-type branched-subunit amino acid transport system substrate-binding protein